MLMLTDCDLFKIYLTLKKIIFEEYTSLQNGDGLGALLSVEI